jgi:uncharacterized protein
VTERLPLFPLGTVLFPGLVMPLHVFEDRYRQLVRDLVALPEGTTRRFGVIAVRTGHELGADGVRAFYEVGCTAEVRTVEAYTDGRYDIVTRGGARFRLRGVESSQDYLHADVDYLDEPSGERTERLTAQVGALFAGYLRVLGTLRATPVVQPTSLPDDPVTLSYLIAATMTLDLTDKQRLLGAPDAATRLHLAAGLLRREASIITALPSLPAVELLRGGINLS